MIATSPFMSGSCAVLLVVVLLASPATVGQTLNVDVDLVNIYFTVCNTKGRLIRNLTRDNFAVFEDDSPQMISHFSKDTDLPMTLALVMDTSGSVRYKLAFEQEAAIDFLNSTLQRSRDKAAIITFDTTVEVRQSYTDDSGLLAAAVRRTTAGGGTGLYNALVFVLDGLARQPGRKGIVLLSDGDDNMSHISPMDVVNLAKRMNVAIYTISVNSIEGSVTHSRRGDGILELFAQETGGVAAFPKQAKELSRYFSQISDELRSQYTIGYRSTNDQRDGAYRKIRIDAKDSRYLVHSRAGYYAPTGREVR